MSIDANFALAFEYGFKFGLMVGLCIGACFLAFTSYLEWRASEKGGKK